MSQETSLLDLVVRWEDLQAEGREISPEELCSDCPELLEPFKAHLQALSGMDRVLNTSQTTVIVPADRHSSDATNAAAEIPKPAQSRWPSIPGYEIIEELNHGGMGVIYKARQIGLDRIVAIKTILTKSSIQESQIARFLREGKVMALLQHPNIVQIYEIGEYEGHPFLVMEFVPGGTLASHFDGKPMAPRKAAEMIATLARAIHSAHQQGIVHRDLKPSNVLMTLDGTLKIADFGVAKCFEAPSDFTQTGQLLGTPSYMAPEQLGEDRNHTGPAVDVYALGATFYELLTGHPPFMADNLLDTLQMIRTQEPIPLEQLQPHTPRDLDTICLKCLEKDPRRRYANALALAQDIANFLEGKPIAARPTGVVERCWRWSRVHPSWAALILAAILTPAIILAVVVVFDRRLAAEFAQVKAAHQQVLITQGKLDRSLTKEVASRLDEDLQEIATVPNVIATLLERHSDWKEDSVEQSLRDMLRKNPLIFGMCVAMEPNQWRPGVDDFALYVYRRPDGLVAEQLLLPGYRPHYREWEWYSIARNTRDGGWCAPYIGEGGDSRPMVTFSAPIFRNDRFVGVVSADLTIDYFHAMRDSVQRLDLGAGSYCLVVSCDGKILAHPRDAFIYPSPDSNLDAIHLDPRVEDFIRHPKALDNDDVTTVLGKDPETGEPADLLLSRIPSTGWTFLIVKRHAPDK